MPSFSNTSWAFFAGFRATILDRVLLTGRSALLALLEQRSGRRVLLTGMSAPLALLERRSGRRVLLTGMSAPLALLEQRSGRSFAGWPCAWRTAARDATRLRGKAVSTFRMPNFDPELTI